jgi:hypothetical protein
LFLAQKIAERENRLLKQISKLEYRKQERKRQRKDSQSASKSEPAAPDTSKDHLETVLPSADQDKKQLEVCYSYVAGNKYLTESRIRNNFWSGQAGFYGSLP